jgi:hypothetical protein
MAMLIDLILKDNLSYFGCLHKTPCLSEVYAQAKTRLLPPNMTSKLQVIDLVVNGPIKAHIRNLRAKRIDQYMDDHRAQCAEAKEKSMTFPKWGMPKTALEQCILDMMGTIRIRKVQRRNTEVFPCHRNNVFQHQ